jgi:hypothetical protein
VELRPRWLGILGIRFERYLATFSFRAAIREGFEQGRVCEEDVFGIAVELATKVPARLG